jgi:hypothetical protein
VVWAMGVVDSRADPGGACGVCAWQVSARREMEQLSRALEMSMLDAGHDGGLNTGMSEDE